MRVGSLFSGYGGLDLAVGGDLAWYSEIEPAACKVLEAHHPGVPNLGDITGVDWSQVDPVDVMTGGYPCQPFSNAGMRKGKDDERHLWPHVRDAIRAIRPNRVVLENVRGHLTLGFETVLADLADLGCSARWGLVRASDVGAPHQRARLFIVADAAGNNSDEPAFADDAQHAGGSWLSQVSPGGISSNAPNSDSPGSQAHDDGRPRRGNARRPQLVERGATAVADPSSERHGGGERPAGVGRVGSQAEGSGRDSIATREEPGAGSVARWGDYAPAINRWQHVIGRAAPSPTIQRAGRDRLNPVFVEWMMGLPAGWVTGHGLTASQELKLLGNGVVPQQARLALQLLGGVA